MKQAFLVPLKGLLVRDPVSKTPLVAEGEMKPMSGSSGTYWKRRIMDGSVVVGENPAAPVKQAPLDSDNKNKSRRRDKQHNKGDE